MLGLAFVLPAAFMLWAIGGIFDGGGSDTTDDTDNGGGGDTGQGDGELMTGTPEPDSLIGTDDRDTIFGSEGDDTISGGAGGDTLYGQEGSDLVTGNQGQDLIHGSGGDRLYGGFGDDIIAVRNSASGSIANGGAGDDTLISDGIAGDLTGADGADVFWIKGDQVNINDGAHVTDYNSEEDVIAFQVNSADIPDGADLIWNKTQFSDSDGIYTRVDLVAADGASNTVLGSVYIDAATNSIDPSEFAIVYSDDIVSDQALAVDKMADDLRDTNEGNDFETIGTGAEAAIRVAGTYGDDDLTATDTASEISGYDGNDTLTGGNGADFVKGNDGDDSILGDAGDDTLDGGSGRDFIDGQVGNDSIEADAGNDTVNGGTGNDYIDGGNGEDSINAGDGNDTVIAGDADDVVQGRGGNDVIEGGWGDDTIDGGMGNDTITGDRGRDIISGGDGDDVITGEGRDSIDGDEGADLIIATDQNTVSGGTGLDTFVAAYDGKTIVIEDLQVNEVTYIEVNIPEGAATLTSSDVSYSVTEVSAADSPNGIAGVMVRTTLPAGYEDDVTDVFYSGITATQFAAMGKVEFLFTVGDTPVDYQSLVSGGGL